jgi:hypothetical protein
MPAAGGVRRNTPQECHVKQRKGGNRTSHARHALLFTFLCEICGKRIERLVPPRIGLCYACRDAAPGRPAQDLRIDGLDMETVQRSSDGY